MSPAKNIASAPRNISIATQALLPIGGFGRTGGEGGSPPPNAGCFASLRGSTSLRRRAVELFAMSQGNWNDGILEQCEGQPSTIPLFQFFPIRLHSFNI